MGDSEGSSKRSTKFVWNDEKDTFLLREILLVEPYKHREKMRERGSAWTQLSDNLNSLPGFAVNMRSVRER